MPGGNRQKLVSVKEGHQVETGTPLYVIIPVSPAKRVHRECGWTKRHLHSAYDMTPEDYRTKWGLPHDYPMVAPAYAERRSQLAKDIGLGRRPAPEPAPTKRVRRKGANSRAA
jgi:hypothetical protein